MKKFIVLLLTVSMALSAFASCGGDSDGGSDKNSSVSDPSVSTPVGEDNSTESEEGSTESEEGSVADESSDADTPPSASELGLVASEALDKISTLNVSIAAANGNGVSYRDYDSDKYGIVSMDGTSDTGAKYFDVSIVNEYFVVSTAEFGGVDDLDKINSKGLVDGNGKTLIPAEYAIIESLSSDKVFKVIKATERTDNRDEALLYFTSNIFSITPDEDDVLYKGEWFIYNVEEGKVLEGISGTSNANVSVMENCISYPGPDNVLAKANLKGEPYPENATVLYNGDYYDNDFVYDAYGNKLFEISSYDIINLQWSEGYYLICEATNNVSQHFVLDGQGNEVSVKFDKRVDISPDKVLLVDEKAYDFDGNLMVDDTVSYVYSNPNYTVLRSYDSKNIYVFDKEGNKIFEGNENDGVEYSSYTETLSKDVDGKTLYYSFVEKDFVYEGQSAYNGYIYLDEEDETDTLINPFTGETLLKGYTSYMVEENNSVVYIIARYNKGEVSFADVYKVK